jgi:hypothetical protein
MTLKIALEIALAQFPRGEIAAVWGDFGSSRIFAELIVFINIDDMETNNQNELTDPGWPSVLSIPQSDEFQQSSAVAQLAAKLWEVEMMAPKSSLSSLEKEKLRPKDFLKEAWDLITGAREHVVRPQTEVEYMVEQGGTPEALANAIGHKRRKSYLLFEKLCNAKRNEGDTELIEGVSWKVYRSERGFDDLFGKYWRDIGEKWKRGDQGIGTLQKLDTEGKPRRINFYSESERKELATLARDTGAWKKRGELLLDSWKMNGVPLADFFALANFRRAHDNRAANLKKPTRRRVVKGRTRRRN